MSNVKSVISSLCRHLNLISGFALKPEFFRQAKFNCENEDKAREFWKILNLLSLTAVEQMQKIKFDQYDLVTATKLYFAILHYPAIEFYSLKMNTNNNRELLIAFAWLLGSQRILHKIMEIKILNSILGKEFSSPEGHLRCETEIGQCDSLSSEIDCIININGKINYNIKAIDDLTRERTELMAKIHVASLNVSGLPHLSVCHAALTKKIAMENSKSSRSLFEREKQEMLLISELLDLHLFWTKKEHIFYDWMVTVIREHENSDFHLNEIELLEIKDFTCLLRNLMNDRFQDKEDRKSPEKMEISLIPRFLRSTVSEETTNLIAAEVTERSKQADEELSSVEEQLSEELRKMLKLIPNCIEI
ncbi:uncharacterized protein [Prorops nasuta]|uniref:uncharacterized protein isoform X2 n=1 Tax=Prorops nasuta TaxID=863751 RepID=UPI0034CE36D1